MEFNEFEYISIKLKIYSYGLNVAFLTLYDFEHEEQYENCHILNECIKKFCKEVNIIYKKEPLNVILNQYKSETLKNNLPIYKNKFKSVFRQIHGCKMHNKI